MEAGKVFELVQPEGENADFVLIQQKLLYYLGKQLNSLWLIFFQFLVCLSYLLDETLRFYVKALPFKVSLEFIVDLDVVLVIRCQVDLVYTLLRRILFILANLLLFLRGH